MTEVLVDDFLEHYGVKGMKWGKRKQRSTSETPKTPFRQRRSVKVAAGIATTAGVVAVTYAMNRHGNVSVSDLVSRVSRSASNPAYTQTVAKGRLASEKVLRQTIGPNPVVKQFSDKVIQDMLDKASSMSPSDLRAHLRSQEHLDELYYGSPS